MLHHLVGRGRPEAPTLPLPLPLTLALALALTLTLTLTLTDLVVVLELLREAVLAQDVDEADEIDLPSRLLGAAWLGLRLGAALLHEEGEALELLVRVRVRVRARARVGVRVRVRRAGSRAPAKPSEVRSTCTR